MGLYLKSYSMLFASLVAFVTIHNIIAQEPAVETTSSTSTTSASTATTPTTSATTTPSAAERSAAAASDVCPTVTRRDENDELILELDNNKNCEIVVSLGKKGKKMKKTKAEKAKKVKGTKKAKKEKKVKGTKKAKKEKKVKGTKKAKKVASNVEFREKVEGEEKCPDMTATKAGKDEILITAVAGELECEILVKKMKKGGGLPMVRTRTVKTVS